MTTNELRVIAMQAQVRCAAATPAPWNVKQASGAYQVVGQKPVARFSGGLRQQAKADAEFAAYAREVLPVLATAALALTRQQPPSEVEPAKESPSAADSFVAAFGETSKGIAPVMLHRFMTAIVAAVDDFCAACGGELAELVSDDALPPAERLIGGRDKVRSLRAQLIHGIASVVDPVYEYTQLPSISASPSELMRVRPKGVDFLNALPLKFRNALLLLHSLSMPAESGCDRRAVLLQAAVAAANGDSRNAAKQLLSDYLHSGKSPTFAASLAAGDLPAIGALLNDEQMPTTEALLIDFSKIF